jgi:hypothetical protein
MTQTTGANETSQSGENEAMVSAAADFSAWTIQAERLVQSEVRRRIERNHAAGRPVYYGATGPEIGKVFERRPDGSDVQIRVLEDGAIEEIGQGDG